MPHQQTAIIRMATVIRVRSVSAVRGPGSWAGAAAHAARRSRVGGFAGYSLPYVAASAVLLAALSLGLVPATARAQAQCCVNPTAETTKQDGADPTYPPYTTDFVQYINENLNDDTLTESNGQVGTDTCYFSGSKVAAVTGVSGGTWTVLDGTWGVDIVGWRKASNGTDPVAYYRQHGRSPCQYTLYQELKLNCNPTPYVGPPGNRLTAKIDSTTQVTNCRYEQLGSDSIPYGSSSACQTLNK